MELASGNQLLFRDRERANEALERALELYTQLQSKGESHPMLLDRARLGAAQAQESLGQLSQAAELYTELGNTAGEKALAELARSRAEQLKLADTRRFYNWFAKQDPASALDQFMTPPRQAQLPDDLGTLSDRPDLSFPGFDPSADDAQPDDASKPDAKTTEPQTTEPQTTEPQTTEPGAQEQGADGAGAQDQVPEAPPLDEGATLPQEDSDAGTQRPDPQPAEEESPNVSAGPDQPSP
jgi:hypothetical protein